MRMSYLKPKEKRKDYPIRLDDIRTSKKREYNAFSFPPEQGEPWYRKEGGQFHKMGSSEK